MMLLHYDENEVMVISFSASVFVMTRIVLYVMHPVFPPGLDLFDYILKHDLFCTSYAKRPLRLPTSTHLPFAIHKTLVIRDLNITMIDLR